MAAVAAATSSVDSPIGRLLSFSISSSLQNPTSSKPIAKIPLTGGTPAAASKLWRSVNVKSLQHARRGRASAGVVCGLEDFIGGDLLGFDLAKWEEDVEKHGALALYAPHEGGYEGRYATRLKFRGYHFLDLTARGLGDVEAYLSKIHGVRPPHLGKQKIVRWYYPPEIDYRLSLLPENSKGLILWLIEAKVLSKSELQYLALLPTLQPKVKVIAECGTWRKVRWKPLREIAGLDLPASTN